MRTSKETRLHSGLTAEKRALSVEKPAKTLTEATRRARTLGDKRTLPDPRSRDFVHITTRSEFCAERFNAKENEILEEVEIAGVRLVWDNLELRAYNNRHDLRSLTIYADTVIFRTAFKFPRTNVTIYARALIFEEEGSIDTSPLVVDVKPATPRDENGNPPDFTLLPGADGEPAGDVTLHVGRVAVEGDTGKKRIICNGGKGQDGEKGGLKPYAPKKRGAKQSEDKNITPFTRDDVRNRLQSAGLNPDNYALPSIPAGMVTARIITYSWSMPPTIEAMFLPGTGGPKIIPLKEFSIPMDDFSWSDLSGQRPGDGEDAYPSGTPGRGGDGGTIHVSTAVSTQDFNKAICDSQGGDPGISEAIFGGDPGTPHSPVHANLFVVKNELEGDGLFQRKPSSRQITLTGIQAGKSQSAPTATKGRDREYAIEGGKQGSWLQPLILEGVIDYARTAYRNGYREEAKAILEPYRKCLDDADKIDTYLKPKLTAVRSLLTSLNHNLDYFGNNIGWVPRLNVTANFRLFENERINAAQLFYFSQRMTEKWDTLKHANDAASSTAAALEVELETIQAALLSAYGEFDQAKTALAEMDAKLGAAKQKFQLVYDRAWSIAERHEEAMRLFKGVCKVAGGLAKVVPVGQPYLGLAGDIVSEIGDHDWTDDDGAFTWETVAANFEGVGKNLGDKIDEFRSNHKDLLIKDAAKAGKKSLKRRVDDAKGAIQSLDDEMAALNAEVESGWEALRGDEVKDLKRRIQALEKSIAEETAGSGDGQKTAKLEAEKLSFKQELKLAYIERMAAAKTRLQKELADKKGTLEEQDRVRKARLLENIDALNKKKEEKESAITNLDKKQEKLDTRLNEAFDAMSGVGDGVASIGGGITQIFAKVDEDKVQTLMDNFETSVLFDVELKKAFRDFKAELDEVNEEKAGAVTALLSTLQRISAYNDALSDSLSSLNILSKQRVTFDGVLNIETRRYLKSMQERAKERLQAYLYEFVKSYQYQYLRDVSDTFYNFDTLVNKLCALESVDTESGAITPVPLAQFQKVEKTVIQEEYLDMARALVSERQRYASESQNSYTCVLSDAQREVLLKEGTLRFNLLHDFNTNMDLGMRDARIVDIDLEFDAALAEGKTDTNLNIMLEHSGTSIIRDVEGRYWFFQIGKEDDPIRWRSVWTYANGEGQLKKDKAYARDEFLDAALSEKGQTIRYHEYLPSLFSDITLWINKGLEGKRRTADIEHVDRLQFVITYTYR